MKDKATTNEENKKKAGRPREFCTEQALETALQLFGRKGYEGTSLSDLTDAIGVNRPSLYAAFGSKEELFRKVLDRYAAHANSALDAALAQPTARRVAEALFSAAFNRTPSDAPGCLLVSGALACSDESETVRCELAARREASVAILRQRFEKAGAGELPPGADPAGAARYLVTVLNGLAVQSAGGASPEDLRRVAEIAIAAWPA